MMVVRYHTTLLAGILAIFLPYSAVNASALFDGTSADAWLVDTETNQLVGYDVGKWLDAYNASDFPGLVLSSRNALLVNNLSNSSVPMTANQPAISISGIGDKAITIAQGGQGGYQNLQLIPATGTYSRTIAVTMSVSAAILEQGGYTLEWSINGGVLNQMTLSARNIRDAQDGYFNHTFYLVADGTYDVDVFLDDLDGNIVSRLSATYKIAAGAAQLRRDTDGDGLPDLVEVDIGLDPLSDDWNVDLDGDGWTELDTWLRRECLDATTKLPIPNSNCLDADGRPVDSDQDNWSDVDELLRGTNPSDPEPTLAGEPIEIQQQRIRYKDYPSVSRLYEVEYQIDTGTLVIPPPAVIGIDQQSQGAALSAYGSVVVQSFVAGSDNLSGVDAVVAADAAGGNDTITLNIWSGALRGELLHSQTLGNVQIDTQSDTVLEFRFEAVAMQPGQTYYLEFRKRQAKLASTGNDSYPAGAVLEADDTVNLSFPDLIFTTYSDASFNAGIAGTPAAMQWGGVVAAGINGDLIYDSQTLLTADEIVQAGVAPAALAARLQSNSADAALSNNKLPLMRLPAGDSIVINAIHRFVPVANDVFDTPSGYSRMYKGWLPRLPDVTPASMLADTGEGSWTTPEEWRNAFLSYLQPRLTITTTPRIDIETTIAVNAVEAVLTEESRLLGIAKQQLFASSTTDSDVRFAVDWEQSLRRFYVPDYNLDQVNQLLTTLLQPGQTLASFADWLRAAFYAAKQGTRSDEYISSLFLDSGVSDCFIRAELLAEWQANTLLWNDFLDRCPVYYTETELDQILTEDRLRRYQARLLLLPDALNNVLSDNSLLATAIDTDSDGISNQNEIDVSADRLTLPWSSDSDADSVTDGQDSCPNDPLDVCSATPVLPVVYADADMTVAEPISGSNVVVIGIRLDRIYDQAVTVFYEALVSTGDTATAGQDFQSVNGSVVIQPGQQTALVEVPVFADGEQELDETFSFQITAVDNAVTGDDGVVVVTLNDTVPINAPPNIILAESNIIVDERASVLLDASQSYDPSGSTVTFSWRQVDSSGVQVTLSNTAVTTPNFDAPETLTTLPLRFEVTATNEAQLTSTAFVDVQVNPVNDAPFVLSVPAYQVSAGLTLELADDTLLAFVDDPDGDVLSITSILQQPSFGVLTDTGNGFSYISDGNTPAVTIDVDSSGAVTGGLASSVLQTFTPTQNNIAGVDAYLTGTAVPNSDVTMNIWFAGAVRIGSPVVTATLQAVPANTMMQFRFSPAFVATNTSYVLEFVVADTLQIGMTVPGAYAGGQVTEAAGAAFTGDADLVFTTYYDPSFNGLPGNIRLAQLSDSAVVDWETLGTGDHIILEESGTAQDFPGSVRIVDYDLNTSNRRLVAEVDSTAIVSQPGSPAVYIRTDTELYRYEPTAAQPLLSLPLSQLLLPSDFFFSSEVAVDPRTGDMHYCGRDPNTGLWSWYRIDHVDMTVTAYGPACTYSETLVTFRVGSRFCVDKRSIILYCTAQNGNELREIIDYSNYFGFQGDYRSLGVRQAGEDALLFIVREEVSSPKDFEVILISDQLALDTMFVNPELPVLLSLTGKEIAALPEVEQLPSGGAVIAIAEPLHIDGTGNTLGLWLWQGDVQNPSMTRLNTGTIPTVADVANSHMGKLKVIGNQLYWQLQEVILDTERIIYKVDTDPAATNVLTEFARVPGSLNSAAPYDILVAGDNSFGYLTPSSSGSRCDFAILDAQGNSNSAQQFIDCNKHASLDNVGLLYEDKSQSPINLFLFGVSSVPTGNTSFTVEVSDPGGKTVGLPVQVEVLAP